jgi:hypothetical protein
MNNTDHERTGRLGESKPCLHGRIDRKCSNPERRPSPAGFGRRQRGRCRRSCRGRSHQSRLLGWLKRPYRRLTRLLDRLRNRRGRLPFGHHRPDRRPSHGLEFDFFNPIRSADRNLHVAAWSDCREGGGQLIGRSQRHAVDRQQLVLNPDARGCRGAVRSHVDHDETASHDRIIDREADPASARDNGPDREG